MHKNYIPKIFPFLLIIIAILGIFSLIDDYGFTKKLKPVSILSDILSPKPEEIDDSTDIEDLPEMNFDTLKSIQTTQSPKPVIPFVCPDSMVCFENYTAHDYPLDSLISNLLSNQQVRIAWFGDSFSEADIVVGDLRDTLQGLYGGNGVGFMPITFEAPGFRRTILHQFDDWDTRSFITHPKATDLGIAGTAYKPNEETYVMYEGSSRFYRHTKKFDRMQLFYTSANDYSIKIRLNNDTTLTRKLEKTDLPKSVIINRANMNKVLVNLSDTTGGVTMYGASLEDETGIYIDNYSIKGNAGYGLLHVHENMLKQFNELLSYDLLILQFGLNVAEPDRTDYNGYIKRMTQVIERLKNAFPGVPVMIISVSDRSTRKNGEYVTMTGVPALIKAQKKIAANNQCLFWNLFEAMGGENSIARFVDAKPPLANKDYTHLNFAGSKKIGLMFAESFVQEVDFYKKRKESK